MIVATLVIENYKQYAGEHTVEFPSQGIVAVTGQNGAGKTTLFEAIEWCLYGPRSIPRDSIPPHDGVGKTLVRVTLEDPADGARFCVQRELRGSRTLAEVYREDDPAQPLVQGSVDVTRYVARHLIGLPHGAFVSTFFTRQKELQFFGDRSETQRRIEVARLLGLAAVREAQHDIGEGRTAARALADSLHGEHERRVGTRDLAAEMDAAMQRIALGTAGEQDAEMAAEAAANAAETARQELEHWREIQVRDASMEHMLATLAGEINTATAQRDAALAHLLRLEQRAAERMRHAAVASQLEARQAAVNQQEEERERAQHARTLATNQRATEDRLVVIMSRVAEIVSEQSEAAAGHVGWAWSATDASELEDSLKRLIAVTGEVDPIALRERVNQLRDVARLYEAEAKQAQLLRKYKQQLQKLEQERDKLLAQETPDARLGKAIEALAAARAEERDAREALVVKRAARDALQRVVRELHEHADDAMCPTCSRELGPGEARRLAADRQDEIAALQQEAQALAEQAERAAARIAQAESAESAARQAGLHVAALNDRLQSGEEMTTDAEAELEHIVQARNVALAASGATRPPSAADVQAASREAEHAQGLSACGSMLQQLQRDTATAHASRAAIEQERRTLGDVSYDADRHRAASADLDEAQRATALVQQIDQDLELRAQYAQLRDDAIGIIASQEEARGLLLKERAALGYSAEQLAQAQGADRQARECAHASRDAHSAARHALREAQAALERLQAEHSALHHLLDNADQQAREADELTRMYDEFSDFDRYVARHVGPLLAETTERMLSQVTSGKYDHVVFDENYGIRVFDGDEAFPLDGFSGGERDVVSLCARLALSEVVGSAAVRPPRFLVLDEVFGSLDSERRVHLLETLGALASAGHFRQMFIISHVDDVQQSPVMSEAWTIEERHGSSQVVRPEFALGLAR